VLTAVQQKYNITPPYLLFLSTLQPRKNLVRLIQAYAAANVPHQLVLAGKTGWLARPIFDAIAQLPAETAQKISLPGFVEDDDKAALLSGATALLYPSLHEGFGFPVLEAQACGTAVICANTSSLPEIAHDSALLIDPLDTSSLTVAIQQITQDETMRKQYQQKGFQNVKRFAWPQVAQRVLTILEGAVQ
jgi:glycosyltransferase involved in cell wall biosynthesis